MKKDIETRSDIELLVNTFYKKILKDATIGYFFTDIVPIDLDKHMPKMYDFWESIIFGKAIYKGNPMLKHIAIHQKEKLKAEHFKQWLFLWEQNINTLFEGPNANIALSKAQQIGGLMQLKVIEK